MSLSRSEYENCLNILGLNTSTTDMSAIKKAYHKLSLKTHPDKFSDRPQKVRDEATKNFQKISVAYKDLEDHYNEKGSFASHTFKYDYFSGTGGSSSGSGFGSSSGSGFGSSSGSGFGSSSGSGFGSSSGSGFGSSSGSGFGSSSGSGFGSSSGSGFGSSSGSGFGSSSGSGSSSSEKPFFRSDGYYYFPLIGLYLPGYGFWDSILGKWWNGGVFVKSYERPIYYSYCDLYYISGYGYYIPGYGFSHTRSRAGDYSGGSRSSDSSYPGFDRGNAKYNPNEGAYAGGSRSSGSSYPGFDRSNAKYNPNEGAYAGGSRSSSGSYPSFDPSNAKYNPNEGAYAGGSRSSGSSYPGFDRSNAKYNPNEGAYAGGSRSSSGSYPSFDRSNAKYNPNEGAYAGGSRSSSSSYPSFDQNNAKFDSNYGKKNSNVEAIKYTRILKIHITGSDGNPNKLDAQLDEEEKNIKNKYKDFKFISFIDQVTKPRLVEGTDMSTGKFVRVYQDSVYFYQKHVDLSALPDKGFVIATVPITEIRDKKYSNGFKLLLDWISDPNHNGKIRITAHGSSIGTIGMDSYGLSGYDPGLKHADVARWLINGGVKKCKNDNFHSDPGKQALRGLTNIHVLSCLAGSYNSKSYDNNPGNGSFDKNHLYNNKKHNISAYNLRPDSFDESNLPSYMRTSEPNYGSGISQYVNVFRKEYNIYGIEITGSVNSVIMHNGKPYRTIEDNSPEQLFIYHAIKDSYDDYKRKAQPSIDTGYGCEEMLISFTEKRYKINKTIQNGSININIEKLGSAGIGFRPYEIEFVKTKLIPDLSSYTLVIPKTNYILTVTSGAHDYKGQVTLCEQLTHSSNKIREVS